MEAATERANTSAARIAAAFLFLATTLLFLGARSNGFVDYDDGTYVLDNPLVSDGLTAAAVRRAFTESHGANWHPVTWLSHALDVELFGLDPAGHHTTSIFLHALNAVLAFTLLFLATGRVRTAFLIAALFAWHPLRVESVAWASERKDLLSGAFGLATCILWLRWAGAWTTGRRVSLATVFALGLMSKPMLVTLPVVLVLLDRWPLGRDGLQWRDKLPLFALSAAAVVVTLATQSAEGATAGLETFPLVARALNALVSCGTYAAQTVWPHGLAVFYPHAAMFDESLAVPALVAGLGLALALGAAYRWRASAPWFGVGLLWYLVMLLPVLGIVQVGMQAHADRYTYLPNIGLVTALVLALEAHLPRRAFVVLLGAALGVLGWRTTVQVGVWRDTETLFTHAARVTERNYVALHNLAIEYAARGDSERAVDALRAELELRPRADDVWAYLGETLFARGDMEGAADAWERAARIAPGAASHSLSKSGAYIALGRLAEAEDALAAARAAGEDGSTLHFNAGLIAQKRGDVDAAEARYSEALTRDATNADAHSNLAQIYLATERPSEAAASFARVVALEPNDGIARFNLAVALEATGDVERARAAYREALERDPTLTPALDALARIDKAKDAGE